MIYVSYTQSNSTFAFKVKSELEKGGHVVALDTYREIQGDTWHEFDTLKQAQTLIIILSENASQSAVCAFEWAFALGRGLPVLVLMKQSVYVPLPLVGLPLLDFTRVQPWQKLLSLLKPQEGTATLSDNAHMLIQKLYDRSALKRCQAVQQLAHHASITVVAELMSLLNDPDFDVKMAVLQSLGNIGHDMAVPRLITFANHEPNSRLLAQTLDTLRQIGDLRALPLFIQHINHVSIYVQEAASRGVMAYQTQIAPMMLRDLQANDYNKRLQAVMILGKLGGYEQALIPMLDDAHMDIRLITLDMLAQMDGIVPHLIQMAQQPQNQIWRVIGRIINILKRIGAHDAAEMVKSGYFLGSGQPHHQSA